MKILMTLFLLLFPFVAYGDTPIYSKKLLPIFCMPVDIFTEGQKRVREEPYVFGVLEKQPHMLFEIYKNTDLKKPTFSATLRNGNEICVLVVGTELLPVWWFEEKCL